MEDVLSNLMTLLMLGFFIVGSVVIAKRIDWNGLITNLRGAVDPYSVEQPGTLETARRSGTKASSQNPRRVRTANKAVRKKTVTSAESVRSLPGKIEELSPAVDQQNKTAPTPKPPAKPKP